MNAVPFLLFLLFVVSVGVIAVVSNWNAVDKLNAVYGEFARQRQGHLVPATFRFRPSVKFAHDGQTVSVDVISVRSGKTRIEYMQVIFPWPKRGLRLEVYPERFFQRLGRLFGVTDLKIGSPEFDDAFIIHGNSPDEIRQLLTPVAQLVIQRLRQLVGNDDIFVQVLGESLLIRKRGLIRDLWALEQLVSLATDLFDQFVLINVDGIHFMDVAVTVRDQQIGHAICQVCGDEVGTEGEIVFCRKCRTPHHRECWEYFGGCSTFGCTEIRTTRR